MKITSCSLSYRHARQSSTRQLKTPRFSFPGYPRLLLLVPSNFIRTQSKPTAMQQVLWLFTLFTLQSAMTQALLSPQPLRPRQSVATRWTNSSLPPNPCNSPQFNPPEYEIANLVVLSNFQDGRPAWQNDSWSRATFSLRDVANNYTLLCDLNSWTVVDYWYWSSDSCVPERGNTTSYPPSLTFLRVLDPTGSSSFGTLDLAQYWYCNIFNGTYP